MLPHHMHLETTTTATTLAASGIGRGRGDILDSSNLHSGTSESAKSGLGSWAGGLGSIAYPSTLATNFLVLSRV